MIRGGPRCHHEGCTRGAQWKLDGDGHLLLCGAHVLFHARRIITEDLTDLRLLLDLIR